MQKTNDLSEEILYNSAASQLICEPKIYTSKISDVKQKAVAELYDAGINSLNQNTIRKAKESYSYFIQAGKLNKSYKDVGKKILEVKDRATLKVIIEPVMAHTQNNVLSFSTKAFYKALFYQLREKFLYSGFVSFYSLEEAQKLNIENSDQIVQIEISDFEIGSRNTPANQNTRSGLSKRMDLIDGKYVWVNVETNYDPGSGQSVHKTTRLLIKGIATLKINSLSEGKAIQKDRILWNYTEELNFSYTAGIEYYSPDNQIFFDHFSLSLCDQVVDRLSLYFREYN